MKTCLWVSLGRRRVPSRNLRVGADLHMLHGVHGSGPSVAALQAPAARRPRSSEFGRILHMQGPRRSRCVASRPGLGVARPLAPCPRARISNRFRHMSTHTLSSVHSLWVLARTPRSHIRHTSVMACHSGTVGVSVSAFTREPCPSAPALDVNGSHRRSSRGEAPTGACAPRQCTNVCAVIAKGHMCNVRGKHFWCVSTLWRHPRHLAA